MQEHLDGAKPATRESLKGKVAEIDRLITKASRTGVWPETVLERLDGFRANLSRELGGETIYISGLSSRPESEIETIKSYRPTAESSLEAYQILVRNVESTELRGLVGTPEDFSEAFASIENEDLNLSAEIQRTLSSINGREAALRTTLDSLAESIITHQSMLNIAAQHRFWSDISLSHLELLEQSVDSKELAADLGDLLTDRTLNEFEQAIRQGSIDAGAKLENLIGQVDSASAFTKERLATELARLADGLDQEQREVFKFLLENQPYESTGSSVLEHLTSSSEVSSEIKSQLSKAIGGGDSNTLSLEDILFEGLHPRLDRSNPRDALSYLMENRNTVERRSQFNRVFEAIREGRLSTADTEAFIQASTEYYRELKERNTGTQDQQRFREALGPDNLRALRDTEGLSSQLQTNLDELLVGLRGGAPNPRTDDTSAFENYLEQYYEDLYNFTQSYLDPANQKGITADWVIKSTENIRFGQEVVLSRNLREWEPDIIERLNAYRTRLEEITEEKISSRVDRQPVPKVPQYDDLAALQRAWEELLDNFTVLSSSLGLEDEDYLKEHNQFLQEFRAEINAAAGADNPDSAAQRAEVQKLIKKFGEYASLIQEDFSTKLKQLPNWGDSLTPNLRRAMLKYINISRIGEVRAAGREKIKVYAGNKKLLIDTAVPININGVVFLYEDDPNASFEERSERNKIIQSLVDSLNELK